MANLCGISLSVALILAILNTSASEGQQKKIRQKREWIIPPHKLKENVNYINQDYIAKIRSDEETRTSIKYSLTGSGADQPPVNLFTVDRETGSVKIHGVLDREKTPVYYLRGVARFLNGSHAEKDIDLRIMVEDENDNAPVLNLTTGAVYERSARDTFAKTITATDADQQGTLHTKIAYSIAEQHPDNMFYINRETGGIHVMHNTLDREKQDTYTLIIKGTDMNGTANGNTGTGTAVIKILDVNDNMPTLEKNFYECSVEENTRNVQVVRIEVTDEDLIYTENWLAVFTIVSGNEAGYFSIITDNKTNEGILILNKLREEYLTSVTDAPSKTATGTIAIQVKDFNDHCPVLSRQSQTLCYEDHVVYVTAVDKDHFPNGSPFGFKVDTISTKESWSIEPLNDTTAIFRSQKTLWPGVYHVFVDVWDQQGKICAAQELQVNVCTCDASKGCLPRKTSSTFGASGVLLMLLGLLLLLCE
ncbi:desmoglein-2-like [Sinocyclocheilus grahami]|uniref:desmoglein-2-like n=1 Tax=Sinocyclocheilus grahami TaxID=75366 RepID=UPI0007ACFBE2|nr:PREDICTED: desmoglein-2-like [Sinocyclocheilus grahami]